MQLFYTKIEASPVDYNSLSKSDFKYMASSRKGSRRRFPYVASVAISIIGAIIVGMVFARPNQPVPTNILSADIPLALKPITEHTKNQAGNSSKNPFAAMRQHVVIDKPVATSSKAETRTTIVVKKGDTLSSIFHRLSIHSELPRVINLGKDAKPFKKMYPGQKLHFIFGKDGISELELEKSPTESVFLHRNGNSFIVKETRRVLNRFPQFAAGTIDSSLFLAGQNAGMSDKLIMDLTGIFGWDIDFALDIRKGDSFTVIYEELHLDGEKVRDGNIIAAEFVNHGKTYQAYRYTSSDNKSRYYAPDGKSMRKPFIRTPVDTARISSYFNLRRRHPILHKIRAHKGVDYAAPTGTPIKATGDGKVIHRGNKGGYGKTIILRHGNIYTTLYAHMSKYARGTGIGRHIKQGQTIGYVGNTGLSTGPHLHYEFRVNGVHRNPLKIKLPSSKSLPNSEIPKFQAAIQPLIAQLDTYTRHALVMRNP